MWAIYYPALAIARVPDVLPHTHGELMTNALRHLLMPRVFFPDKPALISSSDLVRKYSGVWVAGEEENTSIGFGYAIESYIDFGVPNMFIPVVLYGIFIGVVSAWLAKSFRHHELGAAVVTVIAWISLATFERSWVKTLGDAVTLIVYLGGVTIALDRMWHERVRTAAGDDPRASAGNPDQSRSVAGV
jgi:hypothetical protein